MKPINKKPEVIEWEYRLITVLGISGVLAAIGWILYCIGYILYHL
jgi:hypothetical protein